MVESLAEADPHAILPLQRAHLAAVATTFSGSVSRIDSELATAASEIRDMAAQSRDLVGVAGDGQNAFFLEMELCFTQILGTISKCHSLQEKLAAASADLQVSIDELMLFVDNIRAVALQVKWLSLNARIQAIHIGPSGEPLNVISEAMQGLQSECENRCAQTAAHITEMKNLIASIASPEASSPSNQGTNLDEVRANVAVLRASREDCSRRTEDIALSAASLCDDVQSARERFSASLAPFPQTLDRCCRTLDSISAQFPAQLESGSAQRSDAFARAAARYTMQSERDVHEAITGIRLASAPTADTADTATFDDNVELF